MAEVRRIRARPVARVAVRLTIAAEVVEGVVSEHDLEKWVADAIARHHTFRAGFIGSTMSGIAKPEIIGGQHD